MPDVDAEDMPHLKFTALKPRSLHIEIRNTRKVNVEAKNTSAVEKALLDSLSKTLARDGISVTKKSPNSLRILVTDYTGPAADGECVKLLGQMATGFGAQVQAESFGCHQLKHWIGIKLGGNVTSAYQRSLSLLLSYMDEKLSQMADTHARR